MKRTQVYLSSEELDLLDRMARATGASRSELIRRAVRRTYGRSFQAAKLRALEDSAGSWVGRSFSGSDYIDAVRGDVGDGFRRLGQECGC